MAAAGEPHKSLFMYANSNKAVPKSTRNASLELPSRNPSLEECAMRLSLQDGGPPDVTGGLGSRRRRPRRGSSFVSDYVIQGVIGAGKFSEVLEVRKRDPSAPGGLGKAYACKVRFPRNVLFALPQSAFVEGSPSTGPLSPWHAPKLGAPCLPQAVIPLSGISSLRRLDRFPLRSRRTRSEDPEIFANRRGHAVFWGRAELSSLSERG